MNQSAVVRLYRTTASPYPSVADLQSGHHSWGEWLIEGYAGRLSSLPLKPPPRFFAGFHPCSGTKAINMFPPS